MEPISSSALSLASPAPHGGDVWSYQTVFGRDPLDLSINVNPLGMSPSARLAAVESIGRGGAYPDPQCRELRQALAKTLDWPHDASDHVVCGNGASDVLYRLVFAYRPRRALVCHPTFSEYERALRQVGADIVVHNLEARNNFALDSSILDKITSDLDMVVLCEPNNPTGLTCDIALLGAIAQRCQAHRVLLVIDECFNGFLDDPQAHTMRQRVVDSQNLVILDAFTKLYGMAGLRLGYALFSDAGLAHKVASAGQPWAVSSIAQTAGCAALTDDAYLKQTHGLIRVERQCIKEGLQACGCTHVSGDANFVLFYSGFPHLYEELARAGIMVRDCSNFEGLGLGYYRVCVSTQANNQRFLSTLKSILNKTDAKI